VGTYPTALVAKHNGVPFYVLADTLKFDATSLLGYRFHVEDVPARQVPGPDGVTDYEVAGQLFDVTPAELIEGIITERGVFAAAAVGPLMVSLPRSAFIDGLIPAWARHAL
jgi:methylthioribose-1-phosphate isomerase